MAKNVEHLEFADADDVTAFMDSVVYDRPLTPDQERRLLESLPEVDPDEPIMVVQSVRLPVDLVRQIRSAAEDEGLTVSGFIRKALASAMASRERSKLVNVDDVIRAIKSLPHAA